MAAVPLCTAFVCASVSCSPSSRPQPSVIQVARPIVTERPKSVNIPFLKAIPPDFIQHGATNTVYIYNFHLPFGAVANPIRAQIPSEFTFHAGSDSALYNRYPPSGPIRSVSLFLNATKLDSGGVGIKGTEYKWTSVMIEESTSRPLERSIPVK